MATTKTIQTNQWQLQVRPQNGQFKLYWVVKGTHNGKPVENACCLPQYASTHAAYNAAWAWGYDKTIVTVDHPIENILTAV